MRKCDEISHPKSCWNKARDTERLFILLERDLAAPGTITDWADRRVRLGKNKEDDPQILEARGLAQNMLGTLRQEFDGFNARRLELIEKQHAGFTKEEGRRPFEGNPGWKEECERRYQANLTDEERAELATLQEKCSQYLEVLHPRPARPLLLAAPEMDTL